MTEILISIITPVYNRRNLIRETLDSVLNQSFQVWECIIIDDGSTDGTWETLQEYASKDHRFKIFKRHREPKGAPTCRNIGIRNATGNYVMFLDSDDVLGSDCLKYRVDKVIENPQYDVLIFDTSIFRFKIGDDKRIWNILINEKNDLNRFLNMDMPWSISGPLWKNTKMISFIEGKHMGQDWEYHVRFLLMTRSYLKIPSNEKKNHIFSRRNDSIPSLTQDKRSFLDSHNLFVEILDLILENNERNQHDKAIFKLMLREALKLKKNGLNKLAYKSWKMIKRLESVSYYEYYLWYVYIILYNPNTSRLLEFMIYRILKKGELLNNQSTHLSEY